MLSLWVAFAASTKPPPAELDGPQEEPKARLRGPSRKGFSGTQAPDGTISIAEGAPYRKTTVLCCWYHCCKK